MECKSCMPSPVRHDWTQVGREHGYEPLAIERSIEMLEWQRLIPGMEVGMMPGEGIKAAIKELRLPRVSHIAIGCFGSSYGFYGIRAHYKNGRVDIFIIDSGTELTPVRMNFYEQPEE